MPEQKDNSQAQTEESTFSGFDIPRQNWFKIPSNWTDLTASMRSWAEQKVVEYVLRHTWGYQEYGGLKRITLDEFEHGRKRSDGTRIDRGVGMRRQAIISGIRQAVEDGFLIEEKDDSDKARVRKYYGLRMLQHFSQGYENHTSGVRSSYTSGMKITRRSEKDTLERNKRNVVVINTLKKFKVGEEKAGEIAVRHSAEYIEEKIEFLQWRLETKTRGRPVSDPAAWLIRAIEKNYQPPDSFKPKAQRLCPGLVIKSPHINHPTGFPGC